MAEPMKPDAPAATNDTPEVPAAPPLVVRGPEDFSGAINALSEEEERDFYAAFGAMAMRFVNAHLANLRARGERARQVAKTARGIKRRRAKEMHYSANVFYHRLMESTTAATVAAFSKATGREVVFAMGGDEHGDPGDGARQFRNPHGQERVTPGPASEPEVGA